MNTILKTVGLFILMMFNQCFSMGLFKSFEDVNFKENFKDIFKENTKILLGLTTVGIAISTLPKIYKNYSEEKKDNNGKIDFFYNTKNKILTGGLTGLIAACITLKFVKKSFEQQGREILKTKGLAFFRTLINQIIG